MAFEVWRDFWGSSRMNPVGMRRLNQMKLYMWAGLIWDCWQTHNMWCCMWCHKYKNGSFHKWKTIENLKSEPQHLFWPPREKKKKIQPPCKVYWYMCSSIDPLLIWICLMTTAKATRGPESERESVNIFFMSPSVASIACKKPNRSKSQNLRQTMLYLEPGSNFCSVLPESTMARCSVCVMTVHLSGLIL